MSNELHTLQLRGCSPIPLAHYLKALGILRLVSEQSDPHAQGWWRNDVFFLRSKLDRSDLTQFFLNEYSPTPLVAPWNGGSGFFPKDNQAALNAILNSKPVRFSHYRQVISLCQTLLIEQSLTTKPEEEKALLLQICRNRFPDSSLDWLDAAFLLTTEGPKYPPLLGTGGNDGRLEFTNNYMQRLTELFDCETGKPRSETETALQESLFGTQALERSKSPIGQFDPGNAGGPNSTAGYDAGSGINAWDFILLLEGALSFASASTKKLGNTDSGALSYPFCVRASGTGYASAAMTDEITTRSEMWVPLWDHAASFSVVSILLSEGRVETSGRQARNGVDFARAIASLGVDRGITSFQRFGFQQRNGLSYFAVPLSRFDVRSVPGKTELLAPLDGWLDRFRRAATAKAAPARAQRALRQVESAIFDLCQQGRPEDVRAVLIALGEAESAIAISKRMREGDMGSGLSPVPLLSPQWLTHSEGANLIEFRLAASLACIWHEKVGPFRRHLEPFDFEAPFSRWLENPDDPAMVWGGSNLIRNLHAVFQRRLIQILQIGKEAGESELLMPIRGRCTASLSDIATFIEGSVDDQLIDSFLRSLILMNWKPKNAIDVDALKEFKKSAQQSSFRSLPDARYALLKLCYHTQEIDGKAVKLAPQIFRRVISGDGSAATQLAVQRLRASGFRPALNSVPLEGERARRVAAALCFPISESSARRLRNMILRPEENPDRESIQLGNPSEIPTSHVMNAN